MLLIDWLTYLLIGWLHDFLINRLIDWLSDWVADCVIDRLIDWLIDRLIDRSIDWLVYWFIYWLFYSNGLLLFLSTVQCLNISYLRNSPDIFATIVGSIPWQRKLEGTDIPLSLEPIPVLILPEAITLHCQVKLKPHRNCDFMNYK